MTHYGNLGTRRVSDDIRDIRGAIVRGSDGKELGKVDDVVFDHETMEIRYVVMDSSGWWEAGTFLLPADRVSADDNHADGLATATTREQIENSPQYDTNLLRSEDEWNGYEQEFKKYWDEQPVMHMKDSYRIITPPEEPIPAQASSPGEGSSRSGISEINVAKLFPERISDVFSDPAPSSGKVTLRPKSAVRAETAASGVNLLKPRWWEAFENYLRLNKSDIQSKCPQCPSTSDQGREVA
jgi:sporulation protein YlmC with PRC-barrel domain